MFIRDVRAQDARTDTGVVSFFLFFFFPNEYRTRALFRCGYIHRFSGDRVSQARCRLGFRANHVVILSSLRTRRRDKVLQLEIIDKRSRQRQKGRNWCVNGSRHVVCVSL